MKKILVGLLVAVLCLWLCGCGASFSNSYEQVEISNYEVETDDMDINYLISYLDEYGDDLDAGEVYVIFNYSAYNTGTKNIDGGFTVKLTIGENSYSPNTNLRSDMSGHLRDLCLSGFDESKVVKNINSLLAGQDVLCMQVFLVAEADLNKNEGAITITDDENNMQYLCQFTPSSLERAGNG